MFLRYGSGQAAAFLDIQTFEFIGVGPDTVESVTKHSSFLRRKYTSRSGLSGIVVMADSPTIQKARTYMPQYNQYPVFEDLHDKRPFVAVDRNHVLTNYPVIWSVEACLLTNTVTVVTASHEAKLDTDNCMETKQAVAFRNERRESASATIVHRHYGIQSCHDAYVARTVGRSAINCAFADSNTSNGEQHFTGMHVFKDAHGMWAGRVEGVWTNLGTDDPVQAWAETGVRPAWAPDGAVVFFQDGKFVVVRKGRDGGNVRLFDGDSWKERDITYASVFELHRLYLAPFDGWDAVRGHG